MHTVQSIEINMSEFTSLYSNKPGGFTYLPAIIRATRFGEIISIEFPPAVLPHITDPVGLHEHIKAAVASHFYEFNQLN